MISSTGGSVYSRSPKTQTRQAIWSPQPSTQASEPHELSRSSKAMSAPLIRIVGDDTNRHVPGLGRGPDVHLANLDLNAGGGQHISDHGQRCLQAWSVPRHRVHVVRSR